MAKKTQAKTTESTASSWWKERGKIMAMKTESKAVKPKSQKSKLLLISITPFISTKILKNYYDLIYDFLLSHPKVNVNA